MLKDFFLCYSLYKDFNQSGAPGRSRTHNPLIRSQMLYPIELQALIKLSISLHFLLYRFFFLWSTLNPYFFKPSVEGLPF